MLKICCYNTDLGSKISTDWQTAPIAHFLLVHMSGCTQTPSSSTYPLLQKHPL